ncbi:MAG: hypothetical protein ACKKL5_03190 [Candidatus Komeilibacteria bacterium]
MRITTSTNNLVPVLMATISCTFLMLLMGVVSFLAWPLIFYVAKSGISRDINEYTAKDTLKIIEAAKLKGEKSITVRQTIPSGGSLINLPLTKIYKIRFDD